MEHMGGNRDDEKYQEAARQLYSLLAVGDLPGAWLRTKFIMSGTKSGRLPWETAFNCGLCLYRLAEYEKALSPLKQAEQALGSPQDFDLPEKKLFVQALSMTGPGTALLPLHPEGGKDAARYGLLRVRWLITLSLLRLGRRQEADAGIRFLRQYQIEPEVPDVL